MERTRTVRIGAIVCLASIAGLASAWGVEDARFEVESLKAVRPTLVDTITALQQRDLSRAKAAFDAYDTGWNGIEVYVNVRSKDMYQVLELEFQPRIIKGLDQASPDLPAVIRELQEMLAKYDEMVGMVEKAAPLNPVYDDIARLRIVRAQLREVSPALKVGNLAKARKSFEAFEDMWFNIEDFVRARSLDAYVAIESGMVEIERALLNADKPDSAAVTALVGSVMNHYNAVVTELQREARSAK